MSMAMLSPSKIDLITTQEWSREQLDYVLDRAVQLKKLYRQGEVSQTLRGKILSILMGAKSTRTRSALESAVALMGGHSQFIELAGTRLSDGESIADIARVYSCYSHAIGVRPAMEEVGHEYGSANRLVREIARSATVPVIGLADDMFHPTQAIADLLTLREHFNPVARRKFVILWSYAPYSRAMSSIHADLLIMSRYGVDVTLCSPKGFEVDPQVLGWASANASAMGSQVEFTDDRNAALRGADIVFPRNWLSLGLAATNGAGSAQERELHERHRDWMLSEAEMATTQTDSRIMHVLPVIRGHEAASTVMDGPRSLIWPQAENKLFANMAILDALLNGVS